MRITLWQMFFAVTVVAFIVGTAVVALRTPDRPALYIYGAVVGHSVFPVEMRSSLCVIPGGRLTILVRWRGLTFSALLQVPA
jgi:hypothetical protein